MAKTPLPTVDPERTEFGFCRSRCACSDCTLFCRHMPGYLIPADLARIRSFLGERDLINWAQDHVCASPGALVKSEERVFRIPTLVPARRENGACVFLDENDHCEIHAMAPFGCAFFDSHQSPNEADQRSAQGLHAILHDFRTGGEHARIWSTLFHEGLRAAGPEFCLREINKHKSNETQSRKGGPTRNADEL